MNKNNEELFRTQVDLFTRGTERLDAARFMAKCFRRNVVRDGLRAGLSRRRIARESGMNLFSVLRAELSGVQKMDGFSRSEFDDLYDALLSAKTPRSLSPYAKCSKPEGSSEQL